MSQTELQHLAHIRENGTRTNRLLQTINANLTTLVTLQVEQNNRSRSHLELLQEISDSLTGEVDLDELETSVKRLKKVAAVTKQYDASVEIPAKKWWVGQRVVVSEPSSALVGYQGELVAIIGNDSIAVLLDDRGTEAKHFHVNHLTPIPEKIVLPDYEDEGPDIGFSIPRDGVNWCLNDRVMVIDEAAEGYNCIGNVVNARNWPDNFELAVTFAENNVTYAHFIWLRPDQLEKIVKDANDVVLPAEVVEKLPYVTDPDGRLFPWQWRHNLGFDKISEDLREYHRTHENHPMTEEAFRIYNAGLTAEIAQEKHK